MIQPRQCLKMFDRSLHLCPCAFCVMVKIGQGTINHTCLGLAIIVYMWLYTVYDRVFGYFPAKNTVYSPYLYGSGQPYIFCNGQLPSIIHVMLLQGLSLFAYPVFSMVH